LPATQDESDVLSIPTLGPRLGLALAFLLTVFAVAPLAYPGYFEVHSGFLPVYNLHSLRNAPSPLAWRPEIGQPFDPLRGDGLLPYYLASVLQSLGLRPIEAVKTLLALAFLAGALGMYGWALRWSGPGGALLAAVVYTYLPYRLAVVYVRGAWGEALATGLAPAVLWSLDGFWQGQRRRLAYLPLALVLWGGLWFSQSGLALWLVLLAVACLLVRHAPRRYALWLVVGLLAWAGLVVATAGLGPETEAPFGVHFFDHFLYPFQITSAFWGFGASAPGWADGLSLQIGLAPLGLAFAALFLVGHDSGTSLRRLIAFFAGAALAMMLLLFSATAPLWQLSGAYRLLSYPWQLLAWIGLCLAALSSTLPEAEVKSASPLLRTLPVQGALIGLTVLASYAYLEPRFTSLEPGNEPVAVLGGDRIVLLGYNLAVETPIHGMRYKEGNPSLMGIPGPQELVPGQVVHVTLRWQALRPLNQDYKVFVHIVSEADQIQAQKDEERPTGTWRPGEIVMDEYEVAIPAEATPPPYHIALGMYSVQTGERLEVQGRGDGRVIIGE
jgi:hypothetical protein